MDVDCRPRDVAKTLLRKVANALRNRRSVFLSSKIEWMTLNDLGALSAESAPRGARESVSQRATRLLGKLPQASSSAVAISNRASAQQSNCSGHRSICKDFGGIGHGEGLIPPPEVSYTSRPSIKNL